MTNAVVTDSTYPLKSVFLDKVHRLTSTTSGDDQWQAISNAYQSRGRFYHTLDHLQAMLDRLLPLENQLEDPEMVCMAVFYHDMVYNVLRKDNEARSARAAVKFLQQTGTAQERIQACREMILATQHHKDIGLPDCRYLLDADLGVLGSSPESYRQYCRNIRKEYRLFPDRVYKPGRKNVLLHFLEMPRIYKTDIFYDQLETQARENIREELEQL